MKLREQGTVDGAFPGFVFKLSVARQQCFHAQTGEIKVHGFSVVVVNIIFMIKSHERRKAAVLEAYPQTCLEIFVVPGALVYNGGDR